MVWISMVFLLVTAMTSLMILMLGRFVLFRPLSEGLLLLQLRAWQRVGPSLELDWERRSRALTGRRDDRGLFVEVRRHGATRVHTCVTAQLNAPYSLVIQTARRTPLFMTNEPVFRAPKIATGDLRFDTSVAACGDRMVVSSLLNARLRLRLARIGAVIVQCRKQARGVVRIEQRGVVRDPEQLGRLIEAATSIAEIVEASGNSQLERLSRIAKDDPRDAVRHTCLRHLSLTRAHHELTLAAARRCLTSKMPDTRLLAASIVGAEALETLVDLVGSAHISHRFRIQALELLADLDRDLAVEQCARLLARPARTLRLAALKVLGELQGREAETALIEHLGSAPWEEVMTSIGLIRGLKLEGAEMALIQLLSSVHFDVRLMAAEALGELGTLKAVPPLFESKNRGIRRTAKLAIDQIQHRSGADSGRLSTIDEVRTDGHLTLDDSDGALTLPPQPPE